MKGASFLAIGEKGDDEAAVKHEYIDIGDMCTY